MKEIRKCPKCRIYTFREICPRCNNKTNRAIPPKFSPEDPWGKYRRKMKRKLLEKKGWL
ncbi:MAG TPA: RNA-protein complex protein Nop10 [Candidatus Nanopusillus sp.]|nr:RNA-protein complex protein Nop10 [Candidatus Nanopusillus sp.]